MLLALVVCLGTYFFLRKRVARKTILVLLLLFLAGYGIRLFTLLRNPLIYGIDGPYYVVQVKSITETGSPAEAGIEPLVLYFASGASIIVNDATLGIKLTQVFVSTLPILTIWLLAFYLTKNNFASFVATLLITFSAMSIGITDALRNAGALAFLPLFYLFFFKFVNREGREWSIKTPLKIHGKKFALTLNINLILSLLIFIVILGCHFLTAGFAVMTVVAYVAFFTGYMRKIPWRELKFLAVLGIAVLVAMAVSSGIRNKILGTSNTIATSEPVPADMFPFSSASIPIPPGGAERGAISENMFIVFLPFILMAFPAMWFTLRHHDRRYLLFTATIPLALLCFQNWITNYMYSFRLMLMMYIALFVLGGVTVWYLGKHFKKVATAVLIAGVGFSFFSIVGMGPNTGPWITEGTWTELRSIGKQLPENCIITTSEEALFYWGQLLFGKELGTTFFIGGGSTLDGVAQQMRRVQASGMTLAVVQNELVVGENLESFGLQFYDNVRTEHYCVIKLAENSDNAQPRVATQGEGPGGLPLYPSAVNLGWSKEKIQENYYQGHMNLSDNRISAAIYSTTADYTTVLNWYKEQMLGLGWTKTFENSNPAEHWGLASFTKGNDAAMINANVGPGGSMFVLVEGPASALLGGGPSGPGGPEGGGPSQEPAATSEIKFNHNPLFAFILLPIELVQGLYGTSVYGVLKLVIAIPLSVGLIGFLIGLVPLLISKFRKPKLKLPRKRR